MSTKMHDLYCYPKGNIVSLYNWLPTLREQYIQYLVKKIAPLTKLPNDKLWDMLYKETQAGYRSLFNIETSVVIYLDQGNVYIQFFGVPYSLYEGNPDLVDCSYDGRGDMPDDVSEEEWKRRYELAERLFERDESGACPSHTGLSFVLCDQGDCMYVADRVRQAREKEEKDA